MTTEIKAYKEERRDLLGRWESYTRDELIAELDRAIETLEEESRASVRFEINVTSERYDTSEYPYLFMTWKRPETDKEMKERVDRTNLVLKLQKERERVEYERLQKIYGDKK